MVVWFQETHLMADKSGQPDKQQPLELISDFPGEDRHQFVAKLACKPCGESVRPSGSPEADWFRAEQAVHSFLLASGVITPAAKPMPHQRLSEEVFLRYGAWFHLPNLSCVFVNGAVGREFS